MRDRCLKILEITPRSPSEQYGFYHVLALALYQFSLVTWPKLMNFSWIAS